MFHSRKRKTRGKKATDDRKRYPDEFKTIVLNHFKNEREAGKAPTHWQCKHFLKNLPEQYSGTAYIQHVDWKMIKNLVWNNPIKKRISKPKVEKAKKNKKK